MRKLGFLLLFVGFAWLALEQFDIFMRAGLRSVGLAQHAKLSADPNHRYTAGGRFVARFAKRRRQSQDAA